MRNELPKETGGERRLGRYRIIEPLGAGSMGSVYLARDGLLGRDVAVKTVQAAGVPEFQAAMFQARFMNEARAIAALSHPHVLPVYDMGIEDGIPYLVMELAGGKSLRATLDEQGSVALYEARAIGTQIAGALTAAHAQGILHRDVKPANILEVEPNVWKLGDFGVAHVPDSSLTLAGQFVGSPAYAAPEALQRGEFTVACDVYSLAATLYEATSGAGPHGVRGFLSPGALERREAPPDLAERCPNLPPIFAHAITRALAFDPALRPTAAEFGQELSGAVAPGAATLAPSTSAVDVAVWRRRRAIGIGVGVATLLLVGILIGAGSSGDDAEPGRADPYPTPHGATAPPGMPHGTPASWQLDREHASFAPPAHRRSKKQAKRWRKTRQKIDEGKLEDAERELEKLLREDPADEEARVLLQRVRAALEGR